MKHKINSIVISETIHRPYIQSVTVNKLTVNKQSSKLLSLPRLFPISLDCSTRILILAILILCPIE